MYDLILPKDLKSLLKYMSDLASTCSWKTFYVVLQVIVALDDQRLILYIYDHSVTRRKLTTPQYYCRRCLYPSADEFLVANSRACHSVNYYVRNYHTVVPHSCGAYCYSVLTNEDSINCIHTATEETREYREVTFTKSRERHYTRLAHHCCLRSAGQVLLEVQKTRMIQLPHERKRPNTCADSECSNYCVPLKLSVRTRDIQPT